MYWDALWGSGSRVTPVNRKQDTAGHSYEKKVIKDLHIYFNEIQPRQQVSAFTFNRKI